MQGVLYMYVEYLYHSYFCVLKYTEVGICLIFRMKEEYVTGFAKMRIVRTFIATYLEISF